MPAKASARRARRESNRLHRSTERWEDLLSLLLGLLLVTAGGVAFLVGGSTYDSVAERAQQERADRKPVAGVLLEDAATITEAGRSGTRRSPVRWVGADGLEHTGTGTVPGVSHAGQTVSLWEDRSGRLVPPPTSAGDATAAGTLVGLFVGAFAVGIVFLIGWGVFAWTARRYARAWEEEWARVGPEWTGGGSRS